MSVGGARASLTGRRLAAGWPQTGRLSLVGREEFRNVPWAPAAYNARAVSNPSPEFPPVTIACFPVKLACSATSRAVLEPLNVGIAGFFDL